MILVLGSQPAGDRSLSKPDGRLPWHSARPGVTSPGWFWYITVHWPVPNYTAWWQRHVCVNNLPRVAPGSAATRIRTHELLIANSSPPLTTRPPSHTIIIVGYIFNTQSHTHIHHMQAQILTVFPRLPWVKAAFPYGLLPQKSFGDYWSQISAVPHSNTHPPVSKHRHYLSQIYPTRHVTLGSPLYLYL